MRISCCLTLRVSGFNSCLNTCSRTSVPDCDQWPDHLKVNWAPLKASPDVSGWLSQLPEKRRRLMVTCQCKGILRTATLSLGNKVLTPSCFCAWASSVHEWGTAVCACCRWLKKTVITNTIPVTRNWEVFSDKKDALQVPWLCEMLGCSSTCGLMKH